jgi:hypothetical protein
MFILSMSLISKAFAPDSIFGRNSCSAVLRSALRVQVLRGDFSVADRTRGPVACESLRSFGTDNSGGRDFQHTLLSHFHGACGLAAGCGRYCVVVSCDLEGAVRVYLDPSTLRNTGGNNAKPRGDKPMSYSILTLLTRNLDDAARRRAAIDEIFTEDCMFYEPRGVYRGRDEIERVAGAIKATHPDFRYQPIAPPEELGDGGRIRWVSGRPGEAPVYAGADFIIARDGRIAAVYLFFDKLP